MRTADVVTVKAIEDIFPRPDNYEEIKKDIASRGIQEAVVVNTNNELLCGYTRLAISQELALNEIPHRVVDITDFDKMIEYAWRDNKHRRHLTLLQWVEVGLRYEKILSNRHGGDRRSNKFQSGQNEYLENGKTRDLVAKKIQEASGLIMSGSKYERLKTIATKAVKEVKAKLNSREITQAEALALTKVEPEEQVKIIQSGRSNITKNVKKALARQARQEVKDKAKELEPISEVTILAGDMAEVGKEIDDNSVDLILTDPPYAKEFLPEWQKLSDFADRVLKPSGFLVAYTGTMFLDKIISILSTKLNYYWFISLMFTGNTQLEFSRHVKCNHRPVLVYAKPPFKPVDTYFKDTIKGSGRSKDLHDWQQGLGELYPLLETFSKAGDIVVDPFAGSGTTLIAAYQKGRRAIGIEIDKENVEVIKGRLAEVIHDAIDDDGGETNGNGTRHVEKL